MTIFDILATTEHQDYDLDGNPVAKCPECKEEARLSDRGQFSCECGEFGVDQDYLDRVLGQVDYELHRGLA